MTTRWTRKDLLGLRELSADELNFVLETADAFKEVGTREIKKVPALRGKTLVNFFVEPSTRTRTSFGRDQYLGNEFEPDERRNA
jgi:aspartate carbamoyltransferase catalytic subunit